MYKEDEKILSTEWFNFISRKITGIKNIKPKAPYYAIEEKDYISIIVVDEEENFTLIRQFRPAVMDYTIEFPGGHIEVEESPVDAARRELLEETSIISDNLIEIGCLKTDTGRHTNRLWGFVAKNIRIVESKSKEKGLEVISLTKNELKKKIIDGSFDISFHLALLFIAISKKIIKW